MGEIWLPQWTRVNLGGPDGDPYAHEQNVKILWHTWEGTGWSASEDAFRAYPPHVAAKPFDGVHQYVPLDEHAYALLGSRNEGEFVIQVELAGFAHDVRGWPTDVLDWIADHVLEPILFFHDVPDWHPPFYDEQDGITLASPSSPIRFGFTQWTQISGHVGHQHAPAPDAHWDPGCLNVDYLIRRARRAGNQAHQPKGDDVAIVAYYCKVTGKDTVWVAGRTLPRPFPVSGGRDGFGQARAQAFAAGIQLNEEAPAGVAKLVPITIPKPDGTPETHQAWEIGPGDAAQFGLS
jgi:hypothetical protein